MSINFPANPTTGDIFVFNQKKWRWNGYAWDVHPRAEKFESTGILYGGVLSGTVGGTTFSVSEGIGQIVGYTGNEKGVFPTLTEITWGAFTGVTLTNLATSDFTRLYIDSTGNLIQQTAPFDHTDPLSKLIIGTVSHIDRSTISLITNKQHTAYDQFHQLLELYDALGPIKKTGLVVSANGTNLSLNRSAGESLIIGSNYSNSWYEPDTTDIASETVADIARLYRDGSGDFVYDTNSLSFYSVVNPSKYDNNSGTLQTVNNNQWTIQRMYMFPNLQSVIMCYYGRKIYNSYSDALAGVQDEVFTEADITAQNAVFLGYLIVRGGATNLSTTSDAKIIQSGFCRSVGGGGGGGGAGGAQVYYSDSVPTSPSAGDFWFESDTGSFFVYIDDGDSLQWVEVNGQPGPTGDVGATGEAGATGPTGPSGITKYVAGFLYDGRGSAVSPGIKTSVVRPIEENVTVNYFGIRSSGEVSSGVTANVYAVPESYINSAGISYETDGVTIGYIGLSASEIGKTGGTVTISGITLGDLLFCGLEGSGWTGSVQVFVYYEV